MLSKKSGDGKSNPGRTLADQENTHPAVYFM